MTTSMTVSVEDMLFGRITFGLSLAALGLLAVFGYLVYLKAVWKRPDLRKRTGLLLSLCASDILMTLSHTFITSLCCFYGPWPFGEIGCQVHAFVAMTFSFITIGNIVLISQDIRMRESGLANGPSGFKLPILLNWIFGVVGGLLPLFGIGAYGMESEMRVGCVLDYKADGNSNLLYLVIIAVFWLVLPVFKIMNNYGALDKGSANRYLLAVVPMQMAVAWGPYGLASFRTALFGPAFAPQAGLYMVLNVCAKSIFAANPYVYMATDKELKEACWSVVLGNSGEKIQDKKAE